MSNHQFTDIRVAISPNNPSIQRLEFKCIKCGACKTVCTNDIGVCGTYDLAKTGDNPICIHCGQCANVCPVDSITEKFEVYQVAEEIRNPEKIVIVSTSPSVRIALGEEFGMPDGSFVQGKMVALLRKLGVDYVLDTNFSADLTIMEEASELIERIVKGNKPLPQFTSCCPAWVKFMETYYPEMKENVSSAKSPIGMQGPTIKTYFAKKMGIDPTKIVNVALTPCTAKKFEIRRDEMNAASKYLGIEGLQVKVAVVYGTANARKLIEKIKAGEADYHFVEVMTCPGGCIGGGGQPKDKEYKGEALREKRIEGLYKRDDAMQLRLSHENPQIKKLYEEFYGEPLSELAEQMLHTMYFDRSADLGEGYVAPQAEEKPATKQFRCKVCGYIYEGEALPEKYVCPLCKRPASFFEEV